jgi:spermidine synthase
MSKTRQETVVFSRDTRHHHALVVADNPRREERYLYSARKEAMQGGISLSDPDALILEYNRAAFVSLAFLEKDPAAALFVGIGAGAMPRYFQRHYPRARVDVVEVDPDVVEVAKEFFFFRETGRMRVHVADGRRYIEETSALYDMVFLDAYLGDAIPRHLATAEFLAQARDILTDRGVLVSNVISGRGNRHFQSMLETHARVFPHLYVFRCPWSGNHILVASRDARKRTQGEIRRRSQRLMGRKELGLDLLKTNKHFRDYADIRTPDGRHVLLDEAR